ncbi:MAG: hypothetical protein IJH34_11120 [Romboutsia sp.]|nr:hypothetical protein [Romboutsia sp.]
MKNKKNIYNFKRILSIFLGVILILLPMIAVGNASSIKVKQIGDDNVLIRGASRPKRDFISYPVKVLSSDENVLVYCMQRMKFAPTGNSTETLYSVNFNKYPGIEFILKNGQLNRSHIKTGGYMTGKLNENYYITQGALHLFLSYQSGNSGIEGNKIQHIQWIEGASLQRSSGPIRDNIVAFAKDAISYNNKALAAQASEYDTEEVSTNSISKSSQSITLSASSLNFQDKGNTYESNLITVNTPGKKAYSVNLSGVSPSSYVIKDASGKTIQSSIPSGTQFKIVIYKNKINPGKYTVKATVSSAGEDSIKWSYYADKGNDKQAILIPYFDEGGTIGGDAYKKDIKGSFTYCESERLGGEWVETKKLKFNGKTIKEGKTTVGNVVQLNKSYDVLLNIKYNYNLQYEGGNFNNNTNCSPSDIPLPSNLNPNETGTIDYDIKFIKQDESIIQGDKGTTSGTQFKLSSGKQSHVETKVAPTIKLNVPNNRDIVKVKITAILKNSKNEKADEKVIYLYIKESLDEFPDNPKLLGLETNLDDCNTALKGTEVSLKATVGTDAIKTSNYTVKFQVSLNDGGYQDIVTKKVYGVSNGINGATYTKYKIPEKTSKGSDVKKVKFKAILVEDTSSVKYSKVFTLSDIKPESYVNKSDISKRTSSLSNGNVISYLKVQKRDKTKPIYGNCGGCTGTLDEPTCPGKCFLGYTWGEWYTAFVPKEAKKLDNIVENYKIESVLLRSKYTKENKDKTTKINSDGYVDLLKLLSADYEKYVKLKAGYGFEIIVNTRYDNNVPKIVQSVNKQNTINDWNSKVSEVKPFAGSGSVNLIYKDVDNGLSKELNSKKPIMFVAPAADEIAYETPDVFFIKMPNGEYERLDITNGKGTSLTYAQKNNIKQGETIDSTNVIRTKSFEFNLKDGFRKYYIATDVKNKVYQAKAFSPGNGMRLKCDDTNMLSSSYDMKLNVYGGYTDDLKTQLND